MDPKKKSRAKQSPADRQARFDRGDCPIHGLSLLQISAAMKDEGGVFGLVSCSRKDCPVVVKDYYLPECRRELVPEAAFLLSPDGDMPEAIEAARRAAARYRAASVDHDPRKLRRLLKATAASPSWWVSAEVTEDC